MKKIKYKKIIIGILFILIGYNFPLIINNQDIRLFIHLPSFIIVGIVIVCSQFYTMFLNESESKDIKFAIINDIYYYGSLVGTLLGVLIGLYSFLININDFTAVGPGISTMIMSIIFGLSITLYSRVIKSHMKIENKTIFTSIFDFPIIFFIASILTIGVIVLGMCFMRFDINSVFQFEDLIAFIFIFISTIIISKRYIIIINCMVQDYSELELMNYEINNLLLSLIYISILISAFRAILYFINFIEIEPLTIIFARLFFPMIYGIIIITAFVLPLKLRVILVKNKE